MLKKEFQYFLDHQKELVEKYNGKVVVIQEERIIGVYDEIAEAYTYVEKNNLLGKVLIQKVEPGEQAYSSTYHSRAFF